METEQINDREDPIHTEDLQEIIGNPPIWLFRWGITLVLAALSLCAAFSAVISYPEVIKTKLKVHLVNSSTVVSCSDSVRFRKILVQNDQKVVKGQYLAEVEDAFGKIRIVAPQGGRLTYAGILHENVSMKPNQPVFYITGNYRDFYGEMVIPRNNMDQVKSGQTVLISVRDTNNDKDENRTFQGTIKYITDNPLIVEERLAEVDFDTSKKENNSFVFTNGMIADAGIVTVQVSLFHRLLKGFLKTKN